MEDELWRQQVVAGISRLEAKVDALRDMFKDHLTDDASVHERVTYLERSYVSRTAFWTLLIAFATFFAGGYATMASWIHH